MEGPQDQVRVNLRIEGRVQGVYFRASTIAQAQRLGLVGWVMNCPDGAVEAVAEGPRAKIDELIAWCRQGPSGAKVANVVIRWEQTQNAFVGFRIRR